MTLTLKAKYLLIYGLSPFCTGVAVLSLIGLKAIPSSSDEVIGLSTMFQGIFSLVLFGLFSLIIFLIPALITGFCLFDFRNKGKLYQLCASIICGFLTPFTFVFVLTGLNADLIGFSLAAGILGVITSFIVTLKLIYYPLKENRKLE